MNFILISGNLLEVLVEKLVLKDIVLIKVKKLQKEDGMIILECLVLHTPSIVMQYEKYKILYWT